MAAEHVRHPLAGLARVVEVEHRGDGVDADPVGVVLAQPVERVREEEVPHLGAPEVEDERAPVGMRAAPRVGVLVEVRPVEAGERPVVAREVRGHPVEDHADAALVEPVDEVAEVVGRAEARGGRVVAGHLVAPRARERMLHHRQQLDVREAEVGDVVGELVGELAVRQRAVPVQRVPPPRAEMHLVDRDAGRAAGRRRARRSSHSSSCQTCFASQTTDAFAGGTSVWNASGSLFRRRRPSCVRISNLYFVALLDARDEQLPDPGRARASASGAGARPRS